MNKFQRSLSTPFRKISASNKNLLGEALKNVLLLETLATLSDNLFFVWKNTCEKVKNQNMYDVAREIL